jgi:hypothetical protein
MRIYYVGAYLSMYNSKCFGSSTPLHTTLIYSHKWFPYKHKPELYPLVLVPPFTYDQFNGLLVLRFQDLTLEQRHKEFLAAGASWDFTDYKPHITVPKEIPLPRGLVLTGEYYGTWEEQC